MGLFDLFGVDYDYTRRDPMPEPPMWSWGYEARPTSNNNADNNARANNTASTASAGGSSVNTDSTARTGRTAEPEHNTTDNADKVERLTDELNKARERVSREHEIGYQQGVKDVVKSLLPAVQDMERAVDMMGDGNVPTDTVRVMLGKLLNGLRNAGLEQYGERGDEFDPRLHDAVLHEQNHGDTTGSDTTTVIYNVIDHGWRLNGEPVIPAKVVTIDVPARNANSEHTANTVHNDNTANNATTERNVNSERTANNAGTDNTGYAEHRNQLRDALQEAAEYIERDTWEAVNYLQDKLNKLQ